MEQQAGWHFDLSHAQAYLQGCVQARIDGSQGKRKRGAAPAPASSLSSFRAVLRAVAATVAPEAWELDEAGWAKLERLMEDSLRSRPRPLQRRVKLFLGLIQWTPWLWYGRPFTSLDIRRRTRFLSYLESHPIRVIRVGFWGLRTLVMLGYYGQPMVARAIGYRPDPRGWDAPK
ncbi:MAG: hypothetical protein ACE5JI_13390 [Acidobacteriota bacterium]